MLQDELLGILTENRGQLVTGGELSRRLGVSRTAVWKAIHALQEDGNEIETVPNSGYRISENSDGLSLSAIQSMLGTNCFGRSMKLLKSVDSTNTYIKSAFSAGMAEGYTVIAKEQTGGRGRLGRSFHSPRDEGLYLSVLIKPTIQITKLPFLTICAAVAVCRALEESCGIDAEIKWVNDIFVGGKKLSGILTEASFCAELQSVEYAVVGVGVNMAGVPEQVADIATSVYDHTSARGLRCRLAAGILNQMERLYIDYTQNAAQDRILSEYTQRIFIVGRQVGIENLGKRFDATVLGIDDDGALIIEDAAGQVHHISSGEVIL